MFTIKSEEGYWNNEMGWVCSSEEATRFDTDEYDLPIGKDVHWEIVASAFCLNCGHEQEITEENTFYDELGKHTICRNCESSYDLEV